MTLIAWLEIELATELFSHYDTRIPLYIFIVWHRARLELTGLIANTACEALTRKTRDKYCLEIENKVAWDYVEAKSKKQVDGYQKKKNKGMVMLVEGEKGRKS